MALPGEFTQRAFLNGKMDLSQAEAVADLIASNSAASHKLALSQMRGGFSNELAQLREKLLNFVSLIELELDFSEEDVEFADRQNLLNLVNDIHEKISSLANSFMMGNAIKNGIPVAIVGETNVGKSTLLNCLLNEEKAIVSDVHGTTRDVIEDTVQIDGVLFRFIDTAGIRSTDDIVENLGIERTFKKMEEANIVLMIIDSSYVIPEIRKFLDKNLAKVRDKKVVVVFNKTDIITPAKREELSSIELPDNAVKIFLSAKLSQNKQSLLDTLVHYSKAVQTEDNNVVVTNLRHYEALSRAKEAIERVKEGMEQNISGDFLSRDIRDCMHYLGEITGEITTDEVLSNVFGKFCIGK
jgi:tRNA modification GTPase